MKQSLLQKQHVHSLRGDSSQAEPVLCAISLLAGCELTSDERVQRCSRAFRRGTIACRVAVRPDKLAPDIRKG